MDLQIYDPNQEDRMTIFNPRPVDATRRPHEEPIYQSTEYDYQNIYHTLNSSQWHDEKSIQGTMQRASGLYAEKQYEQEIRNVEAEFTYKFILRNESDDIKPFIESKSRGGFIMNPQFENVQKTLQSMYDRVNYHYKMYLQYWQNFHDGNENLSRGERLLRGLHDFRESWKGRETDGRNELENRGYIIFPKDSLLGKEMTEYRGMPHMSKRLQEIYKYMAKFDKLRRGIDDVPAYFVSGEVAWFNPEFKTMQQEMQSLYDKVHQRVWFQNDPTSPNHGHHEANWSKRDYHVMNNDLEHILHVRNLLQEKKNLRQKFLQERGCNITGE